MCYNFKLNPTAMQLYCVLFNIIIMAVYFPDGENFTFQTDRSFAKYIGYKVFFSVPYSSAPPFPSAPFPFPSSSSPSSSPLRLCPPCCRSVPLKGKLYTVPPTHANSSPGDNMRQLVHHFERVIMIFDLKAVGMRIEVLPSYRNLLFISWQ